MIYDGHAAYVLSWPMNWVVLLFESSVFSIWDDRNTTQVVHHDSVQGGAPKIAKLVYKSNNYCRVFGGYNTIVTMVYKPTYINGLFFGENLQERPIFNRKILGFPVNFFP